MGNDVICYDEEKGEEWAEGGNAELHGSRAKWEILVKYLCKDSNFIKVDGGTPPALSRLGSPLMDFVQVPQQGC